MHEIIWPEKFLPGTTDNYASNEVIVKGLTTARVWPYLNNATIWPTYYNNASQIVFDDDAGPELSLGAHFRFTTFGLIIEAEVVEHEAPAPGKPARLAWRARVDGPEDKAIAAYHAWLIEDLPGGRVRILSQESVIGKPAQEMAKAKPNPMLNAHQDWIEGLAQTAQQSRQ